MTQETRTRLPIVIKIVHGMPDGSILMCPPRYLNESDEAYAKRCGLIKNVDLAAESVAKEAPA